MRKTLFPVMAIGAAGLLTLTASLVAAQTTVPASVTETAKYVTDRLTTELKLTPEQIPKVQAINEKSTAELEKMIEKFAADTTAASDAALVQALVQTSHSNTAQLKTVLTPEQFAMHQRNRADRLALNQTEIMTYTLDLSRSQILAVERINSQSAPRILAAVEAPAGTTRTREQMLEAGRPAMDARDKELEKVLTAAQMNQLKANRRALRDLFLKQLTSP
ncbi:MAG TPA: hypothetical protein VNM36_07245 [Gemmatimonadaceae bacterium]|nr:hypothetical protein [Gemmatimonadaceae bacterium]